MDCGVPDGILEQKMDTGGKTGKAGTNPTFVKKLCAYVNIFVLRGTPNVLVPARTR